MRGRLNKKKKKPAAAFFLLSTNQRRFSFVAVEIGFFFAFFLLQFRGRVSPSKSDWPAGHQLLLPSFTEFFKQLQSNLRWQREIRSQINNKNNQWVCVKKKEKERRTRSTTSCYRVFLPSFTEFFTQQLVAAYRIRFHEEFTFTDNQ